MSATRATIWLLSCDGEDNGERCIETYDGMGTFGLAVTRIVAAGEGDDGSPGWRFVPGYRVGPLTALLGRDRSVPDRDYCPKHRPDLGQEMSD